MRSERRTARILQVLRARQPDLTVVLENIHDPHNVSAILRSCDAVGIPVVDLLYTTERFPAIGKKSSSSAGKWVQRRKHGSVKECYDYLRKEGFTICATHLGAEAVPLYSLDLTGKTALVFGNEHRGVTDEAAGCADVTFRIPMVGMIESLNVSVACAVVLYEAFRQRMQTGKPERGGFSETELRTWFNEWIRK
jgi:tRNA (guanosine-2'-O-)-methyltransferase